jgi:ankyrin repeat protein
MLILLLVFRYGDTPLHISALNGRVEVCRVLLQSGADVNARTK